MKDKCRAVNDILVRWQGKDKGATDFSETEYWVLSRDYLPWCSDGHTQPCNVCGADKASPCVLENELRPLSKMVDEAFATLKDEAFRYASPAGRVADWISENSGDIILLPNMEQQYFFDKDPLISTHGSLFRADAEVPLAFSYPGATSREQKLDNVLHDVRKLLGNEQPAFGLDMSIERRAMESALGLAPCQNSEAKGCTEPQP